MQNYLTNIYRRCLYANYTHVDEDGDFCIHPEGDTLYLLFQWTHSTSDWINNFSFPAKPYKDMGVKWYCHRGFLRVWKAIEPYLKEAVSNQKYTKIVVAGYSHGAAIASLCHEYVWFNRPDLRDGGLEGYGFGCPRVFFGWYITKQLRERWKTFYPIRNANDIVTHVPPILLGFRHVNKVLCLPKVPQTKMTWFSPVNAHYPCNYLAGLSEWDRLQEDN